MTIRASETESDRDYSFLVRAWKRYGPLVSLALKLTAAIAAFMVVPPWLSYLIPRWLIPEVCMGFLEFLFAAYVVAIPVAVIGGAYALFRTGRALCRRDRAEFRGRLAGALGVELSRRTDRNGGGRSGQDAACRGIFPIYRPHSHRDRPRTLLLFSMRP